MKRLDPNMPAELAKGQPMRSLLIIVSLMGFGVLAHSKECFDQQAYNRAIQSGQSGERALKEAAHPCGSEISNVQINAYDCTVGTVSSNKGKCVIVVAVDGKERRLVASPEVAAPWGNGYGDYACRPMNRLSMIVSSKSEIITVRDEGGRVITTKFDYSR